MKTLIAAAVLFSTMVACDKVEESIKAKVSVKEDRGWKPGDADCADAADRLKLDRIIMREIER